MNEAQASPITNYYIHVDNSSGIAIGDRATVAMETSAAKALFSFAPNDLLNTTQQLFSAITAVNSFDSHFLVEREIAADVQKALSSSTRYLVLKGASGTGKTIFLQTFGKKLLNDNWVVVFCKGSNFSLDALAESLIKDGLGKLDNLVDWRSIFITPRQLPNSDEVRGLILLIDDVDRVKTEVLDQELNKLHIALHHVLPERVKIIATCRDYSWENKLLPFFQNSDSPASSSVQIVTIADFTSAELAGALQLTGDTTLLNPQKPGESPDPHVEMLRELLRHPSLFGIYTQLNLSGDSTSKQPSSWSGLLASYSEMLVEKARSRCGSAEDFLKDQLIHLAQLAREKESRDWMVNKECVRQQLPDLQIDQILPTISRSSSLREVGILVETQTTTGLQAIRFADGDLASYYLSFSLEREFLGQKLSDEEVSLYINNLLDEASSKFPLLDALLLWVDRESQKKDKKVLRVLLY